MRYFDDFSIGQELQLAPQTITRVELIAFAAEFDPQPFHLDEAAGSQTLLGGLSASGWHTCAIFMRMMCDGWLNQTASMGSPGIEAVKWLHPVRAGDRLAGSSQVIEMRASKSRPNMGIIRFRHVVANSRGVSVLDMVNPIMFSRREGAET
jgi:acyl dehydratase